MQALFHTAKAIVLVISKAHGHVPCVNAVCTREMMGHEIERSQKAVCWLCNLHIRFVRGKRPVRILHDSTAARREKSSARALDSSDLLYLILPLIDRADTQHI